MRDGSGRCRINVFLPPLGRGVKEKRYLYGNTMYISPKIKELQLGLSISHIEKVDIDKKWFERI